MYAGAIFPGLVLTALYAIYVFGVTLIYPKAAPALPPEARTLRGLRIDQRDSEDIDRVQRSEEHTSELQSADHLVCRLLLEKKKNIVSPTLPACGSRVDASELLVYAPLLLNHSTFSAETRRYTLVVPTEPRLRWSERVSRGP